MSFLSVLKREEKEKSREEEIRELLIEKNELVNISGDAIRVIDDDFNVVLQNDLMEKWTGKDEGVK